MKPEWSTRLSQSVRSGCQARAGQHSGDGPRTGVFPCYGVLRRFPQKSSGFGIAEAICIPDGNMTGEGGRIPRVHGSAVPALPIPTRRKSFHDLLFLPLLWHEPSARTRMEGAKVPMSPVWAVLGARQRREPGQPEDRGRPVRGCRRGGSRTTPWTPRRFSPVPIPAGPSRPCRPAGHELAKAARPGSCPPSPATRSSANSAAAAWGGRVPGAAPNDLEAFPSWAASAEDAQGLRARTTLAPSST
jgi:hypothetical protein